MDNNETYNMWKAERANVDLSNDFSCKVMDTIHLYEKKKTTGVINNLLSQIDFLPNPLQRTTFTLGCVLLGIFRIYYISANILVP